MGNIISWACFEPVFAFYSAKHDGAGIVMETKKIVDMMGIDKVELDKMILIVDRLTEGN